ncbi:DUF6549 family protein [Alistipes sp. CHKCI003]|uniref:DUF6549 family protein n=1 Tax=Alistipes sp. CHKCI003 TaxID=1780376 RepID=UPI001C0D86AF|nr:DUF6549 family protein [Alistipes sp. CHKCI003]
MKRYLFLYAVCATALLVYGYRRHRAEVSRLGQNQTALAAEVERYRNRLGEAAASAQALRLRCAEYEELRAADAERIRRLGIRLRRLEATATAVAATEVGFRAPLAAFAAPHDRAPEPHTARKAIRPRTQHPLRPPVPPQLRPQRRKPSRTPPLPFRCGRCRTARRPSCPTARFPAASGKPFPAAHRRSAAPGAPTPHTPRAPSPAPHPGLSAGATHGLRSKGS